jgi:hypothetical protein
MDNFGSLPFFPNQNGREPQFLFLDLFRSVWVGKAVRGTGHGEIARV